jgi:uncharacterized protein
MWGYAKLLLMVGLLPALLQADVGLELQARGGLGNHQPRAEEGPAEVQRQPSAPTRSADAGGDFTQAFGRLLAAARQGHLEAAEQLVGFWRRIGYVPAELELAFHEWLGESPEALGLTAEEAAQLQFRAGVLYFEGRAAARDYAHAARWWQRSAMRGHTEAKLHLGMLYSEGMGVARDDARALHWIRNAAQHGNAAAQFQLGLLYEYGRGVPRDDVQAYVWYTRAARQGHRQAQEHRLILAEDLAPSLLAEAERQTEAPR